MEEQRRSSHAQARTEASPSRPAAAGPIAIIGQEKLANVPGKTLTVQIAELPPGGKIPEHHHGGPTFAYVLSGAVRMQLKGGPDLVYEAGQTVFESADSVHLFAVNPSSTEPAKIMLIHVADDGAQLVVFHETGGART
jgi:quercetin dioxygenase-like cupin family protein